MRKKMVVLFATALSLMFSAGVAFANPHNLGPVDDQTKGDRLYTGNFSAGECIQCHEDSAKHTTGPHGGYTAQSNKCQTCHDVHVSEYTQRGTAGEINEQLLPGTTLTNACNYCHDLTGSKDGPYNATGGLVANAAHRVEDLAIDFNFRDSENHLNNTPYVSGIIPGADPLWGTSGTITPYANTTDYSKGEQGRLSGSNFTCDSCHTPHGVNTVRSYLGESEVKVGTNALAQPVIYFTNRLLKKNPNQAYNVGAADPTPVDEYGTKWCMGCHGGRDEIQSDHNHPVAAIDKNTGGELKGYYFLEEAGWDQTEIDAAIVNGFVTVSGTDSPATFELAADPRSNKQYALTVEDWVYGAAGRPDGNKEYKDYVSKDPTTGESLVDNGPSCQMCHGSARDVEATFAPLSNPERLSFPHISANKAFTVETGDDFCTNCHAPNMLP